jgi:hypothetical protein
MSGLFLIVEAKVTVALLFYLFLYDVSDACREQRFTSLAFIASY